MKNKGEAPKFSITPLIKNSFKIVEVYGYEELVFFTSNSTKLSIHFKAPAVSVGQVAELYACYGFI